MHRHLIAVGASLALSACVVQPPPGYWDRPSPYAQTFYPPPYSQGWNTPAPARMTPSPQTSWSPQPASYSPPPASWAPQPEAGAPRTGDDSTFESGDSRGTFAEEAVDYGVRPTNTLHLTDFDAPTPTRIQGARTITTIELEEMLASSRPPVLIDVIGGAQTVSLPGAIWLRDAGVGRHLDDDIQAWFDLHLSQVTARDKSRPVVFFCASRMCWLAHNAALRALDLGYTDVYWYRGGRDAWQAAGLPMVPVAPSPLDN
jgi:PQQ-dependent catabolism-associated CXXCW motif protein